MILLVNEGNNQLAIYDSEYYGSETWGSNSQDAIEFKRKHWYITHWNAGSTQFPEDLPDEKYAYKLNVIAEFQTIQECQDYLENNLIYSLEYLRNNKIAFEKSFQNGHVTFKKQFMIMYKNKHISDEYIPFKWWQDCNKYCIEDLELEIKHFLFEDDYYIEYRDII